MQRISNFSFELSLKIENLGNIGVADAGGVQIGELLARLNRRAK
jgi:hypothetical protein